MPEDVNTFKVDKNTKYQMVGGELGTVDVSREEFEINFKACLDSGLYFEVEIVDGVATTIQICS